ncbi:MAG: hypothetical protein DRP90_07710 [Planctomycetota bacterium]|nr:MAG: hypothetical protein DRP90_07710 [Planctomycetota bacterium]
MRRRPDGFTLIEVLAAVAILATAFYFLLELRQSSLSSAIFASRRFIALQVARTKMEETLAEGFPDPKVESGEVAGVKYTVNVLDIGDEENIGALRRIDVQASVEIGFGEEGRVVLSTIVSPLAIKILPKPAGENGGEAPPAEGRRKP